MYVVSWNMAKSTGIPIEYVLKACERWGAKMLVVQEPTGSLLHFGSKGGESKPRGCVYSWRGHYHAGGTQGSIVIATREDVVISNIKGIDLNLGQGSKRITKTNPFVMFDAQEGGERLTFGTCHAPYDESARSQFARKAVEEGAAKGAHCVLGDMNTYGTATPGKSRTRGGSGFQTPSLGATSAKGLGSPLDKVYVADKVGLRYQTGRIAPSSQRIKRSPGLSDQVVDIIDDEWEECKSDHLPIYIALYDQADDLQNDLKRDHDDDSDDEDDSGHTSKKARFGKNAGGLGSKAIKTK